MTTIRRQGSPWTEDERALLVRMREGNHDVASIAATLKRPIESVYAVCKRLLRAGQLGPKRGRPWTTRELAALGDITLPDEELAALLGRTKAAVKKKRLGLSLRPRLPRVLANRKAAGPMKRSRVSSGDLSAGH